MILFHPYHEEDQSDVLGSAITYQKRYEEVKESVALVRQRYEKYRAQVEEAAAAREDSEDNLQFFAAHFAPNTIAQEEKDLFAGQEVRSR